MDGAALLLIPSGLQIERISAGATTLTVSVTSTMPTSPCPLCGAGATRIPSRYQRTVADAPCGGRQVRLLLTVRKFFCDTPDCARKIFTERLVPFIEPWARMPTRLTHALHSIGLATCGKLGARLAARLGMSSSWMTILRQVMALPFSPPARVLCLGLDDFSFRRGRTFGTGLVDLEKQQVIDLVPDRQAETATSWMHTHPEITHVSRDRSREYARAASGGAPQAMEAS